MCFPSPFPKFLQSKIVLGLCLASLAASGSSAHLNNFQSQLSVPTNLASNVAILQQSSLVLLASIGGSDVGGGGSLQLPLATDEELQKAIGNGKIALNMWLFAKEIEFISNPKIDNPVAYQKIFRGSRSIYDVINHLTVEFRLNGACLDKNGNPFDGSVYTSLEPGVSDAICISGSRLVTKLRKDDFMSQTEALILHEASHLVGTSEPEAVAIQTDALEGNLALPRHYEMMWAGFDTLESEIESLGRQLPGAYTLQSPELGARLHEIRMSLFKSTEFLNVSYHELDQSGLSPAMSDRALSAHARIVNIGWATCALADDGITPCHVLYEKMFNGQSNLKASAFLDSNSPQFPTRPLWATNGILVDESILYIRSTVDLKAALNDLQADVEALYNAERDLVYERVSANEQKLSAFNVVKTGVH